MRRRRFDPCIDLLIGLPDQTSEINRKYTSLCVLERSDPVGFWFQRANLIAFHPKFMEIDWEERGRRSTEMVNRIITATREAMHRSDNIAYHNLVTGMQEKLDKIIMWNWGLTDEEPTFT